MYSHQKLFNRWERRVNCSLCLVRKVPGTLAGLFRSRWECVNRPKTC